MRENIRRLGHDECWEIVDRHRLGRIAVIEAGRATVLPVNFAKDGSVLVVRTRHGSTVASVADGRHAVLEVDEIDEELERGTSVIVHGRLRQIVHDDEHQRVAGLGLHPWAGGDREVFVRLDVEDITGRTVPMSALAADGLAADGG